MRLLEQSLQLPEPSDEACRRHYAAHAERLSHRRARARAPHPVRGDAGRRRGRAAQARRSRSCSMCAAMTARPSTALPRRRASFPTARAASRAAIWAGCVDDRLRAGIRARAVRSHRGGRAAAAGAQPLRPARGRSAGARVRASCSLSRPCSGAVAMALRQQTFVTALRQYLQPARRRGRASKASSSTPPTRRWCNDHEHREF